MTRIQMINESLSSVRPPRYEVILKVFMRLSSLYNQSFPTFFEELSDIKNNLHADSHSKL